MQDQENMFGKQRGRFDETAARTAVTATVDRVAWGFASLPAADKLAAMNLFNKLHNDPRSSGKRFKIVEID